MSFLEAQTACVAPLLCPECNADEIRTRVQHQEARIEAAIATKLGVEGRETCVL